MTTLAGVRAELAVDIQAAGYKTMDTSLAGINPPVAVIAHGDPWLESGDTFAPLDFKTHLDVILLAGTGTNGRALGSMEAMVTDVILGLPDHWQVDRVSEPYLSKPNGTEYLTCELQISRTITLSA